MKPFLFIFLFVSNSYEERVYLKQIKTVAVNELSGLFPGPLSHITQPLKYPFWNRV